MQVWEITAFCKTRLIDRTLLICKKMAGHGINKAFTSKAFFYVLFFGNLL